MLRELVQNITIERRHENVGLVTDNISPAHLLDKMVAGWDIEGITFTECDVMDIGTNSFQGQGIVLAKLLQECPAIPKRRLRDCRL